MHVDNSRGTFEDILRHSTLAAAEIAAAVRRLIEDLLPGVTEIPRPAEQYADYAVGGGKMTDVFVYISPVKAYVRLGFYFGAALPDPAGLLEGTGKRLRHIKLHAVSDAQRSDVRALILAAIEERKNAMIS